MKSKKVISLFLVTAMATTLLAGCGGSKDTPAAPGDNTAANNTADAAPTDTPSKTPEAGAAPVEEQTLRVAAFEGGYGADMWSEVTAAFEASHPGVTVELCTSQQKLNT